MKESKDPFEPTRDLFDKVVDSENVLKLKARGRDLRETVKETREGYQAPPPLNGGMGGLADSPRFFKMFHIL